MKHSTKIAAAAVVLLLLPAAALPSKAGKIVTDSLESKILGTEIKFNVYLPESFGKTDTQYPVVYLLHGLSDDYTTWKERGNMQFVADELMRSGEAREMIIVMPGAGSADVHHTHSGYFNVPGWNYEDFFFNEFIPEVESRYRVISDKGHRAIMGLSMGGGGSTAYCQKHPDKFSSCYAMSAWLDNKSNAVSAPEEEKDCLYLTCESVKQNSALDFLDRADEATLEKLRSVKWFFDCGDDDFLFDLSVELHKKMRKAGVKDELRIRDGVHNWEYWHLALRMALPFASRNFY